MGHATLTVSLPEEIWIGELSRRFPEARFRVLAATPGGSGGFGVVRITAAEPSPIAGEMAEYFGLVEATPLYGTDESLTVQFETTRPLLLGSARAAGLPIEPPIEIRDGEARFGVTASADRLSELCAQLRRLDLEFRVDEASPGRDPARPLSEVQRELLREAVERGYYDTPRGCTLTELAEAVGIAKSTCSETLHRAEGAIVKGFVSDPLEPAAFE